MHFTSKDDLWQAAATVKAKTANAITNYFNERFIYFISKQESVINI